MSLRQVWAIQLGPGHLRLQYETLSQKNLIAYKLLTIQHYITVSAMDLFG